MSAYILIIVLLSAPTLGAAERVILDSTHEQAVRLLGKHASQLPQGQWLLLAGKGLGRNIVIRQLKQGSDLFFYVLNPGWWSVDVTLCFSSPSKSLQITDLMTGKAAPAVGEASAAGKTQPAQPERRPAESLQLRVKLTPHSIRLFRSTPAVTFESAQTVVDASVKEWAQGKVKDILAFLPQLPTRRPNMLKNGDFELVTSADMPADWTIFNWHRKGSLFAADTVDVYNGKRSFSMDNSAHGLTVGIHTGRINVCPNRTYTLSAWMGSNDQFGRARLCLAGEGHLSQGFLLSDVWREYSLTLPAAKTREIGRNYAICAEIHADAKGCVWVDDAKLLDTTECGPSAAAVVESTLKPLESAQKDQDYLRCCSILEIKELASLLRHIAERKRGNEWMVVGPFACTDDRDFPKVLPPETDALKGNVSSQKDYAAVDGRKVRWIADWTVSFPVQIRRRLVERPGFLDLGGTIGAYNWCVAYGYTRVYSPANQAVMLLIGSDDCIAAWVNGKKVCAVIKERAARPAENIVPAELKVGWNDILVKVHNHEKDWGFFFAIADADGRPLKGITYSPSGRDSTPQPLPPAASAADLPPLAHALCSSGFDGLRHLQDTFSKCVAGVETVECSTRGRNSSHTRQAVQIHKPQQYSTLRKSALPGTRVALLSR